MVNTPNENPEKNKKEEKNLVGEAQELFIESKLSSDLNFFDSISTADIFNEFKKFLNKKGKFKELGLTVSGYTTDQQNTLAEQILEEKNKVLFLRKKNLKDLQQIFEKEYTSIDITKLKNSISNESIVEISKLIKSESKRRKFLLKNNIFDSEEKLFQSKKSDEKNLLENIGLSKKSFDRLDEDTKDRLIYLFNNYKKINFSDLESILKVLNDKKSKENLLKYFISSISVSDLEKVGAFNSEMKKNILNSIKSELGVSEDEAKEIYKSIEKDKLFINVDDLESFDLSSLLENKSIQKQILDEYNSEIEESGLDENIQNSLKLDNRGNIHKNFIKFVKNSSKISQEIKDQINLLEKGNYFEISGGEKKGFYNIKSIDNGTSVSSKTMAFENITSYSGVKKLGKGYDEIHTYEDFFNLLEKISSTDPKNNFSIKFYTKDDFEQAGFKETVDGSEDISSYEDLLKGLDEIDPEGKEFGLDENKTTLIKKDEKEGDFVFLIRKIDKIGQTVTIDQGGSLGNIKVSFKDLFSVMKGNSGNLKRAKKINSFSELVSQPGIKGFENLELKNGKIIDKNDKTKKAITSFVGEGDKGIVIKEISDYGIKYVIGDIDKKGNERVLKKGLSSSNFSQFFEDIKNHNFVPEGVKSFEEEKVKEPETKGSSFSKFLSWLSIKDIINSGDFIYDSIKKKLERGNRLKSLIFAGWISKILGKEYYGHILSQKEAEEKSLVEEIKDSLQKRDSKEMMEQVLLIIQNKDSEMHEKIGAMFAVLKYGNLYPKGLAPYAGSFMWYKALGGTEEFKRQEEQKAIEEGINFREEDLVRSWLNKNKGFFRSKLHKDFIKEISSGEGEELEAGKRDSGEKNTYNGRLKFFVDALKSREYAGAIGSIETVLGKASGDPFKYHAPGFIFAMSGYGKNLSQPLRSKMQGLGYSTASLSFFYCFSDEQHIKYKNFIKSLITNAPDFESNRKSALSDFEKIFKHKDGPSVGAKDFWDKYGENITKYLNYDDAMVALKSEEIPEFKEYYETSKSTWSDKEFGMKDEDIETGIYFKNPVSISGSGKVLDKITGNATGGFGKGGEEVFNMYIKTLNGVKNGTGNMDQKRKIFKSVFEPFERRIVEIHGQYIQGVNTIKHPIYASLVSNGLDMIKSQTKPADYDTQIDKIFNNFMNSSSSFSQSSENIQKNTKLSINDILSSSNDLSNNQSASNDENYEQAA